MDTEKAATADVLSEMLKNCGTKNNSLKDVLKKFDLYGINIDSSANDYGIYLAADFPTETAAKSLSLFNEMITKPDLVKKYLTKQSKIVEIIIPQLNHHRGTNLTKQF